MTTSLTPSAGTILIGDDEAPVLRVLQRILKRSGYAVLSAVDGQEAVDVFQAHDGTVDLVILDVTMPRLSGVEAATRIRALAPDIKIMISSGYDAGTATADAPDPPELPLACLDTGGADGGAPPPPPFATASEAAPAAAAAAADAAEPTDARGTSSSEEST